jgi:hypothetical protein
LLQKREGQNALPFSFFVGALFVRLRSLGVWLTLGGSRAVILSLPRALSAFASIYNRQTAQGEHAASDGTWFEHQLLDLSRSSGVSRQILGLFSAGVAV